MTSIAIARHAARLAAVQALYQSEMAAIGGDPVATGPLIDEYLAHRLGKEIDELAASNPDRDLFKDLVAGADARVVEIDELIAPLLRSGWSMERIDRIAKAILRLGTYELMARPDIPSAVVIDEYVELAKAFFEGKEPTFVNGVLDQLNRQLRPAGTGEQTAPLT